MMIDGNSAWMLVMGYALGSIPFGVLISAAFGLGNLRKIGSGNIGATNVLRTGNKLAAFLTLLLDGGKGAVAVLLAARFAPDIPMAAHLAAAGAFVGHCYPIWLRLKGGKGVATFLGILLALDVMVGLAACSIWLIVAFALRISSLSALVAAAAAPMLLWIMGQPTLIPAGLAALVFWRHHSNITRLIAGTEPKIGQKT